MGCVGFRILCGGYDPENVNMYFDGTWVTFEVEVENGVTIIIGYVVYNVVNH